MKQFDFLFHKSGPMEGQPRGYCFVNFNTREVGEGGRGLEGRGGGALGSNGGPYLSWPGPGGNQISVYFHGRCPPRRSLQRKCVFIFTLVLRCVVPASEEPAAAGGGVPRTPLRQGGIISPYCFRRLSVEANYLMTVSITGPGF